MDDSPIRHTIRQVILPLVQAIYDEDPSDILMFCCKYFENLLKKRERETGAQVQGSCSEPLLTAGGRSLRESSSWSGPTKGRSTQNPDITTGIGEQPDLKAPSEDNFQIDAQSGDAHENKTETVGEEVKTSNKILSFGFIPLLNESESDPDKSLQKKYSETLQNLAQKFNSAENNLNVELQNAKEISDIVQGRCQNEEKTSTTKKDIIVQGRCRNEEETSTATRDISDIVQGRRPNEEETSTATRDISDLVQERCLNEEEISTATRDISDIVQGRCLNEEEISTATRDISKEEDSRQRNHNDSRLVVDESWRKKWYDVHPRIERLLRTKRIFTGNRRNLSGDVPSRWFEVSVAENTQNKTNQPVETTLDGEDTHQCSPSRKEGASEEEILADSEDQDPNKEETCTENCIVSEECLDTDLRKSRESKVEPGLNSACGDFTNRPMQAITAEYVEGVMDRLMQQQSLNDTYEGLHFSSYSESESSNVESDNGME